MEKNIIMLDTVIYPIPTENSGYTMLWEPKQMPLLIEN